MKKTKLVLLFLICAFGSLKSQIVLEKQISCGCEKTSNSLYFFTISSAFEGNLEVVIGEKVIFKGLCKKGGIYLIRTSEMLTDELIKVNVSTWETHFLKLTQNNCSVLLLTIGDKIRLSSFEDNFTKKDKFEYGQFMNLRGINDVEDLFKVF